MSNLVKPHQNTTGFESSQFLCQFDFQDFVHFSVLKYTKAYLSLKSLPSVCNKDVI